MKTSDTIALLLLGAIWGASFLFMRMGADEFGGMALAGMRAIGAAICSAPLLLSRQRLGEMATHWRPIVIVGLANSALPFVLFSYAAKSLPAGVSAISDAIAPLLVALSGWMLFSEKLNATQASGLVIGFTGGIGLARTNLLLIKGASVLGVRAGEAVRRDPELGKARLKTLEDENTRLKKLLTEAMLDNAILKDVAAKKW